MKQGDVLSPSLFNFALEYAIRRFQVNQDVIKQEEQKVRTQYGTFLQGCQLQRHELHYSGDCATVGGSLAQIEFKVDESRKGGSALVVNDSETKNSWSDACGLPKSLQTSTSEFN